MHPQTPTEQAIHNAAYRAAHTPGLLLGVCATGAIGWLATPYVPDAWFEVAAGALALASLGIIPITGETAAKLWADSRLRAHRRIH